MEQGITSRRRGSEHGRVRKQRDLAWKDVASSAIVFERRKS